MNQGTRMKRYVLGFCFTPNGGCFLIEKTKPEWQRGLVNGLGGKIEAGESIYAAMVREFAEESGIVTHEKHWQHGLTIRGGNWELNVLRGILGDCPSILPVTDEGEVQLFFSPPNNMEQSARWFYWMCRDDSTFGLLSDVTCVNSTDGDEYTCGGKNKMGWLQFSELLEKGEGDLVLWKIAADGNPNTPQDALRVALRNAILHAPDPRKQQEALGKTSAAVIGLVQESFQTVTSLVATLRFVQEMAEEDIREGRAERTALHDIEACAREALSLLDKPVDEEP